MSTRTSLDQIEVQTPCKMDWNEMSGSDKQRYCDHCHLHVYNLSTLTEDEAQKLICREAGQLCVRFARLPDGRVLTTDRIPTLSYRTAPARARYSWRLWSLISLVAAGAAGFTGWFRKPAPPPAPGFQVTVGSLCSVPSPSPAPQAPPANSKQ